MPKGVNISKERRLNVWKMMILDGMSAVEIYDSVLFRGQNSLISLKRLQDLQTMFYGNEQVTIEYLSASSQRGNIGFQSFELLDFIMKELARIHPLSTIEFYRDQLVTIRGFEAQEFSLNQVRLSLRRCLLNIKRITYVSAR